MKPGRPGDEEPYTLDDLIRDEKRQSRWVLVIFIGAVIFVGGRSLLGDRETPAPPPAAEVTSQQ